jgi:hypothetical protein
MCAVTLRSKAGEGNSESKYLAAYVTLVEGCGAEDAIKLELRAHSAKQLTEYMVPSVFVVLKKMPLLVSSKIDRKSLPEPNVESFSSAGAADCVAPRTDMEVQLGALVQNVLGLSQVSVEENIFHLGMTSLLMLRLTRLMSDAGLNVGGRRATMGDIIANPSVAQLAHVLSTQSAMEVEQALKPVGTSGRFPLSPEQSGLYTLFQLSASASYNVNRTLRLKGELNIDTLENAFDFVTRRHVVVRCRFSTDGHGRPVQTPDLSSAIPFVRASSDTVPSAQALNNKFCMSAFDLDKELAVRVLCVEITAFDHLLSLCFHHIVMDGISLNLLLSEVWEVLLFLIDYYSLLPLPPPPYHCLHTLELEVMLDRVCYVY